MKKQHITLLIFSFCLLEHIASAKHHCRPAFCGPNEPEVRFPFRIIGRQPDRCGFPGFDLSCDEQNKTTLQLPSSLSYIVTNISYLSQVINIDPEFCRPNRIVSLNKTNTPFSDSVLSRLSFYNCSSQNYSFTYPYVPYPCLSSGNYSVIASLNDNFEPGYSPLNCNATKMIEVPVRWNADVREGLELMWYTPYCRSCERKGKSCRWKSDVGDTICVSGGVSRSVKYGLSIGLGVPGLICIIGLVCYASSKVQANNDSRNQGIDLSSVPINPRQASRTGLDGPTIESYPKTVLGDGCSLPNDESTCSICLSDYKPKESLRTIPDCNHYFHVACIDEWLKLHATCPVCRKTQESSVLVSPCSKASSSA